MNQHEEHSLIKLLNLSCFSDITNSKHLELFNKVYEALSQDEDADDYIHRISPMPLFEKPISGVEDLYYGSQDNFVYTLVKNYILGTLQLLTERLDDVIRKPDVLYVDLEGDVITLCNTEEWLHEYENNPEHKDLLVKCVKEWSNTFGLISNHEVITDLVTA